MFKITIYLVYFLIVYGAQGSEINTVLKGFNAVQTMNQDRFESCHLEEQNNQYRLCVESLCGKPSEVPSFAMNDENFKRKVLKQAHLSSNQLIKEITGQYQAFLSEEKEALNAIENLYAEKKLATEPLLWSDGKFSSMVWDLYLPHISFDKKKPELNIPKDYSVELKEGLKKYFEAYVQFLSQNSFEQVRRKVLSLDQIKSLMQQRWKNILELGPSLKKDKVVSALAKEMEKMESLSFADLRSLYLRMGALEEEQFKGTDFAVPYRKLCQSAECLKGLKSHAEKVSIPKILSRFKIQKSSEAEIHEYAKECLEDYALNKKRDEYFDQFKDNMPQVLELFLNNQNVLKSDETKKGFKDFVGQKVSFKGNSSSYNSSFSNVLSKINKGHDPLDALGDFPENNTFFSFYPCRRFEFLGGDHIRSDGDQIRLVVSNFSSKNSDYGYQIFLHEVAHLLSHYMRSLGVSAESKDAFLKIRQCASAQTKNLKNALPIRSLHHQGDHLKTEEDTADIISAMLTPKQSPIPFCAMLSRDPFLNQWEPSLGESEKDEHSDVLLRILRDAIYRERPLSNECESLIDSLSSRYNFTNCAKLP